MPGPWSRTRSSPPLTVTSTLDPGTLHLPAFSSRFQAARSSRSLEPVSVVGSRLASNVRSGKRLRARSTTLSTSSSKRNVVFSRRESSPRASSSSPPMRSRISWASRWRSSNRRCLAPGSSRSCCFSTSMFVCMLVSGVRSSCDASATKRRCVSIASSSAASIVLNDVPSRASSPRPPSGTRSLGSPVFVIRSAAAESGYGHDDLAQREAFNRRVAVEALGGAGGDVLDARVDRQRSRRLAVRVDERRVVAHEGPETGPRVLGIALDVPCMLRDRAVHLRVQLVPHDEVRRHRCGGDDDCDDARGNEGEA